MINAFRFQLHTETFAGIDYHKKIPELMQERGHDQIFMIIDEGVSKSEPVTTIINQLKQQNRLAGIKLTRGTKEPDYDYLDAVVEELRTYSMDAIVAIGGGSALDLSKAVAVLLTNPGKGIDYRGFDKVQQPGIPLMAVPTTAGTGSEITINAVFTDTKEQRKLGINGRYLNATYALLDPVFTVSAPKSVAISSGVDALVHTLESFVGTNANCLTRSFAREAFRLLYHNLPCIVDDPTNLDMRLNIQIGAYLAATSLFNSSSGIAGALSYPLGVHYDVPHGIGGGMFALPVVKYNVEHGYYDYAELYDMISDADRHLSAADKSKRFVECLEVLCSKLEVPSSLKSFNISQSDYDHVVSIMQPLQAAFDQNPVSLPMEEVGKILEPFFE